MSWFESSRGARDGCRASLFVFVLALAGLAPVSAAAGSGPSFTLEPVRPSSAVSYFIFDSRPGATVGGAVRIANDGDRPGAVRLYGVDAVTGDTTGAVYRARTDSRRDVGAWISLPTHRLRLSPGQSRVVRFQAQVPAGARPGHHLGGIVAENATLKTSRRETGSGSFQVDIRNLTILAVQVNLPGEPVEELRLEGVEPGPAEGFQTLLIGMQNAGNRLLKGSGSVIVSDESGEELKRAEFKLDTFVPQTEIDFPFAIPGQALPAGRYLAEVTVRYGDGKITRLTEWFSISDDQVEQVFGSDSEGPAPGDSSSILPLLLGALAALLLASLAAWALLRRRRSNVPDSPVYITAVHMPHGAGYEHIELVQWQSPGTLETGQSSQEAIAAWIQAGGNLWVRDPAGKDVRVGVVSEESPYIRTHADGSWTDDLLLLPRY